MDDEQRPLGKPPYTMFHNYTLDVMMRDLSPNAWKVLCLAIRKTWGWVDPTTDSGRKEQDRISYSQFMEGTGIRSRTTISQAIQECLEAGYLLRCQVGQDARSGKPLFTYALNTDFRPASSPEIGPLVSSPVSGLLSSPVSGLLSSPETGLTKEKKQTKKRPVVAVLSAEQQQALDALTSLGVDPATAKKLAGTCDPGDVAGWVSYAKKAQGLDNAAGLVVARLRAGEPAPAPGGDGDRDDADRRRFISGEYAEYIQH